MQENTRLQQQVVARKTKAVAVRRVKAAENEFKVQDFEADLKNEVTVNPVKTEVISVDSLSDVSEEEEKVETMHSLVRRSNDQLLSELRSIREALSHRKQETPGQTHISFELRTLR